MAGCATCLHKNVHPNVCSDCLGGTHFKPRIKTKTNADRIRAMSDEELADFIMDVQGDVANYYCGNYLSEPCLPTKKEAWLEWLRMQ